MLISLLLHTFAGQAISASATAITSDGTLGTIVNQGGTTFDITGGTRNGANLFHSLGLFSIGAGDTANFLNDTGLATTNILGRVTGGQVSNIFGTIQTTNFGAAHLFLINPSGWVFGPTASLNVGGSFHVSTADYLKFADADGTKFYADLSKDSSLTSAPVSAFGFLSQNPQRISVQGSSLQVPDGQTLSIVGGDLFIVGEPSLTSQDIPTLAAPGGKIQLASVASPGEVPLNVQDMNLDGFPRLGEIKLSNSALLDASGDGGGAVVIRGGKLLVDSSFMFADNRGNIDGAAMGMDIDIAGDAFIQSGSFITTDGNGAGRARDLQIAADTLWVNNSVIGSRPSGSGDGGNVTLNIENLTLTGGATISSNTSGSRNGGTVRVTASDTIALAGVDSTITASSESGSTGNAGDVVVEAKNVTLTGGALIRSETLGSGKGGTVRVMARDSVSLDGADTQISASTGATGSGGGDIVIEANNLALTGGAGIKSDTFGAAKGGTVRVTASETITLDGADTGIFADASSTGGAGDIVILPKNLALTGGAGISSDTSDAGQGGTVRITAGDTVRVDGLSFISARSFVGPGTGGGTGHSGDVVIEAKNLALTGGAGIHSDTFGSGKGGTVQVTARDTLTLDGADTQISSSTFDLSMGGHGGNVVTEAQNMALTGGARIASDTFGFGKGGTVRVTAIDKLILTGASPDGELSSISSRSFGDGTGGTVEIRASQVNLNDQASISAKSSASGNAGDINIRANEFRSANSSVTTEADFADGGNIHLTVVKLVYLLNSQITASVGTGNGSGGNITIDPTFVVLNNSQITANAFGGPGGNIRIVADVFLASPDSSITASSALSTPGTVDIQAAITNLNGVLEPLPENIFQATSLLQQSCAARFSGGKLSSLVVGSRDGLPLEPGGFMPSPLSRLADQKSEVPSTALRTDSSQTSEVGGQRSALGIQTSEVGDQRSEFQHALASVKPKFFLNGPCVK